MIWEKLKELLGIEAKEPVVFHEEWITLLQQNVPLYERLPEELRLRLHERIAQFIATIRFEGCGGLELTEAMILTVAAQACLLVVQREGRPYPKLSAVYLYPTTFSSVSQRRDDHGIVSDVNRIGAASAHQATAERAGACGVCFKVRRCRDRANGTGVRGVAAVSHHHA